MIFKCAAVFMQTYLNFYVQDGLTEYAISMSWFKCWDSFLNGIISEPPGPIDNSKLIDKSDGQTLGILHS